MQSLNDYLIFPFSYSNTYFMNASLLLKKLLIFIVLIFVVQHRSAGQDSLATVVKEDSIPVKIEALNETTKIANQTRIEVEALNKKRQQLENQIQALRRKQNATQQDIGELNTKMQELTKIGNDLQLRNDTLNKLAKTLEEETENLKKGVSDLNKEKEALQKETDTLKKQKIDVAKTIESLEATIAKQKDSAEVIAEIIMNDSVKVRGINGNINRWEKAKIKQVHIIVREGQMTEIVVETTLGTFRNKKSVIDMLHFELRGDDTLRYVNKVYRKDGKSLFVYLDDVIIYTPTRSYLNLPYTDFETTLVPTEKVYRIKESTSINTYFEIAAFTDLKGISGEPNGIAQFAADAKFITNTINISNTPSTLFHYIAFHGELAKFDNDFRGTPLIDNDSVNRRDLLQRSNYKVGVKVNVLRSFSPPSPLFLFSDLQINIGYNFIGSRVFDTLLKAAEIIDTSFRMVTQNQFYIEPKLVFSRHRNFSMSIMLPVHFISVKESAQIRNHQLAYWASPGISLMYFGKREAGSKLFFRYNHYINLKEKTQAFSQMQIGYAVNLTDVWSRNNK